MLAKIGLKALSFTDEMKPHINQAKFQLRELSNP
jgi:hypothetical protein